MDLAKEAYRQALLKIDRIDCTCEASIVARNALEDGSDLDIAAQAEAEDGPRVPFVKTTGGGGGR